VPALQEAVLDSGLGNAVGWPCMIWANTLRSKGLPFPEQFAASSSDATPSRPPRCSSTTMALKHGALALQDSPSTPNRPDRIGYDPAPRRLARQPLGRIPPFGEGWLGGRWRASTTAISSRPLCGWPSVSTSLPATLIRFGSGRSGLPFRWVTGGWIKLASRTATAFISHSSVRELHQALNALSPWLCAAD